MEEGHPEEELYERLAVALGEPLEQVWRMPDVERKQLIAVMNLETTVTVEEQERCGGRYEADIAMIEDYSIDSNVEDRVVAGHQEKICGDEIEVKDTVTEEGSVGSGVVGLDEKVSWVSPLERRLKEDTARLKRLLTGTTNETMVEEVLEAYLQSHSDNPDRVKVVLEELAGVEAWADADTSMPDLFVAANNEEQSHEKGEGKR